MPKLYDIEERDASAMLIRVECYAGHRGEETPRRIRIGGGEMTITDIVDSWLAPDHRYFKCQTADGAQWIIRHDDRSGLWELTHYRRGGLSANRG